MSPTEKHRETAERIIRVMDASLNRNIDCFEAEGIRSAYDELRQKNDFTTASVKARAGYLAAALATAEREGMKLAAEIVRTAEYLPPKLVNPKTGEDGSARFRMLFARAILSEARER